MPLGIVTKRQLVNAATGIDIHVPNLDMTGAKKEPLFAILVVTKWKQFKAADVLPDAVVQFAIKKSLTEMQKFSEAMTFQHPGSVLPPFPKKGFLTKEFTPHLKASAELLKIIAASEKLSQSPVLINFIGVNNAEEEDPDSASPQDEEKTEQATAQSKAKQNPFDETTEDVDLFVNDEGDQKTKYDHELTSHPTKSFGASSASSRPQIKMFSGFELDDDDTTPEGQNATSEAARESDDDELDFSSYSKASAESSAKLSKISAILESQVKISSGLAAVEVDESESAVDDGNILDYINNNLEEDDSDVNLF